MRFLTAGEYAAKIAVGLKGADPAKDLFVSLTSERKTPLKVKVSNCRGAPQLEQNYVFGPNASQFKRKFQEVLESEGPPATKKTYTAKQREEAKRQFAAWTIVNSDY